MAKFTHLILILPFMLNNAFASSEFGTTGNSFSDEGGSLRLGPSTTSPSINNTTESVSQPIQTINTSHVIVFGLDTCPHTRRAIDKLDAAGIQNAYVNVESADYEYNYAKPIQNMLKQQSKRPQGVPYFEYNGVMYLHSEADSLIERLSGKTE